MCPHTRGHDSSIECCVGYLHSFGVGYICNKAFFAKGFLGFGFIRVGL